MRKIKRFITESDSEINAFLETIQPTSVKPCGMIAETIPHEDGGGVNIYNPILVTWEEGSEDETLNELVNERAEIEIMRPIAERLLQDMRYKELKNKKQREVYLLEEYGIVKSQVETLLAIAYLTD